MGRILGIVILAIVIAGLGYSANYLHPFPINPPAGDEVTPPDEPPPESTAIHAQGRLEPEGGTIAVSGLPGEEIVELLVDVGDKVEKGNELAILGSKAIRDAEVSLAESRRSEAVTQLASEKEVSILRMQAADLAVELAKARRQEVPTDDLLEVLVKRKTLAQDQLGTLQELRAAPATANAISDAEISQQQLLIQQLDAEILQNKRKMDAAKDVARLALEAAEVDSKLTAKADKVLNEGDPIGVADKTVRLAELSAAATEVTAPCSGEVLEIYVREGERISNTPVLLMADLSSMICVVEVHESQLQKLIGDSNAKSGDNELAPVKPFSVTIESGALGSKPLMGKVIEVGRLIGAPKLRDPNPLARTDVRTAQVKIDLDKESRERAERFVNLQVNVEIQLEPQETK